MFPLFFFGDQLIMEGDYYDDSLGEDNALSSLQWNENFYEAVDDSIYRAVGEAMAPLEERLTTKIDQAMAHLASLQVATPPPASMNFPETASSPPSAKRLRDSGMDTPAFDRVKKAFLATNPAVPTALQPPVTPVPPQPGPSCPDNAHQSTDVSDMFDPEDIVHPRSSEWAPADKVTEYVALRIRKPLDKDARNCLRAECPRPSLEGKVALTPEIDTRKATFLQKFMRDPKKGIDRSWRSCQDKLLVVLGPLTKILDMAEEAKTSGSIISPDSLSGWAQRAIVFLGNANCALSTERRRSLLIKVDPKLGDLADTEAGAIAQGGLFVEPFVKELGKFVNPFTSLDKAQSTIKRVFPGFSVGPVEAGAARLAGAPIPSNVDKALKEDNSRTNPVSETFIHHEAGEAKAATSEELTLPTVSLLPFSQLKIGGRLAIFFQAWISVTGDSWVLQTIRGFHIEFMGTPFQRSRPTPLQFSRHDTALVNKEVSSLLVKGAIVRASLHPQGFLSNLFLVDKVDGGKRPVINLSSFNEWLVYRHFKMEGIHLLWDMLHPNDWMVRLDLKDAYLVIPIFPPIVGSFNFYGKTKYSSLSPSRSVCLQPLGVSPRSSSR